MVRYALDGSVDAELEIPTAQPTCIAFAGKNLDLLFVTSAREGMSPQTLASQPHAGDVFVYKLDVKGLADARFADPRPPRDSRNSG